MNMELVKTLAGLLDRALTPEGVEVEYVAVHIERALRAAYIRGVSDARYTDIHPGQHDAYTDAQEGVTAGVAAMVEEL